MTIKKIKEHYPLVSNLDTDTYIVYGPNGKRSTSKYLATIHKKGRSFFVTGYKPTTKIETLKEQINDFVSKLPYDSEYYNPCWREGHKDYIIVYDYLDSINFKSGYLDGDGFHLKTPSIYGYQATKISLFIYGLDVLNLKDTVEICLSTGDYSWVSVKCKRDAATIIENIDSLLKPLLVTEAVSNIKVSDKLKMSDIDITLKQLKNLDIKETDMKTYLKNELLKIANTL
jgi:hypothetical protein